MYCLTFFYQVSDKGEQLNVSIFHSLLSSHQIMGHCILIKLDLNSCSSIKQCLMEDESSIRKVIGNAFRYQVNR